ncbi:hypothetical protein DEO72_LG3g2471 [Vigna unguiculata]|uniref:Uncharacterized protein n=1 Tax=Vigna unguiculata TaxID=3917 RepID=A0A4D6LH60_VIGUN|nr:hypothetical protein DEO72_LG3g2471 [Vigna unguiculata]
MSHLLLPLHSVAGLELKRLLLVVCLLLPINSSMSHLLLPLHSVAGLELKRLLLVVCLLLPINSSMSRSEGCACSSWASQKNSVSSPTVSYRSAGGTPMCYCGERSGANEESKGCNYFKWFNEDNRDERDATIGRQRRKIYALEK